MKLSKSKVDSILTNFNLPKSIKITTLGGWANQNILVKTVDFNEYVIKILVLQKEELITNDVFIQKQLNDIDIKAPKYIRGNNGKYLFQDNNIKAVVSNKINGTHITKLTPEFCYEIGKILAVFQKSIKSIPNKNIGWLNKKNAQNSLLINDNLNFIQFAKKLIHESFFIFNENLPTGIIHGDLHEENVLVNSEKIPTIISIMDFEETENNILIIDLARTILSVSRNNKGTGLLKEKAKNVVSGYESIRTLEKREKELLLNTLQYVIGVEAIWLYKHGFINEAKEHVQRADNFILP